MAPFKVFVTHSDWHQEALDLMRKEGFEVIDSPGGENLSRNELLQRIKGVDALFWTPQSGKVDQELLDAVGPSLKVVGTVSVGYDHIDVELMKKAGVKVGYTPDILTDAVAELTVGVLLATSRRLFEGNQELLSGRWVWSPTWLCGVALKDSTVGIFGLGRIGQAIMDRLKPFDVKRFVYNSRNKNPKVTDAEFVSFNELLKVSDFVVISAAYSEETKEIFNAAAFSQMKPNSILVNSSRGGLIDQNALEVALRTGQIRAAGLDVMTPEPLPADHPLTKLPNCVLVPHMGSAEVETRLGMATVTARNIIAGLKGQEMPARLV